jgi:hypothetical protein
VSLHALHLGISFNYGGPSNAHLLDLAEILGVKYLRWGIDITDYMSTPNNTSSFGTLDLSPVANLIDDVHGRNSADGSPMSAIVSVLGVPRKVNPSSGSSDPAPGGKDHWFATDSTGRGIVSSYTVDVANLLDPALDRIQLGNEVNNGAFNHDGTASPGPGAVGANATTVAHQVADQCIAVRSSGPSGLKIYSPSLMNYGDINAVTGPQVTLNAAAFAGAMVAGDARLKNTGGDARFDAWMHHNYTGSAPPLAGVGISGGHTYLSGGYGWASPQLLAMRATLATAGVTSPTGSILKMGVSEYGIRRSGTYGGFTYTESIQNDYLGQALFLYEFCRQEGWLTAPTCWHTMIGADEDKNLFRPSPSLTPYLSGRTYIDFAHTDEVVVPPPTDPPVANFTANPPLASYTGTSVVFTDHSSNGPTSWAWTFGDGGTSTAQHPNHTFAAAGTYTVTLTATNAGGSDGFSVSWHVFDLTPPPPPDPGIGPIVTVWLGIPTTAFSDSNTWSVGTSPRGETNSSWVVADRFHWYDITNDADTIGGYSVQRGRTNSLEPTSVGTASISMRNDRPGTAADYDSQNWLSPYFPSLLSGRARLRILIDGAYIFEGIINEQPITDEIGDIVTTTFHAEDYLSLLARQNIVYYPEAVHTAGKRLARLAEMADVCPPEESFWFPGVYTYQKGVRYEDSALSLMSDVMFAEGGYLYCSGGGPSGASINFVDRNHMSTPTSPPLFTLTDGPTNGSDRIQYAGIVRNDGLDLVYNDITFKTPDIGRHEGITAHAFDARSANQYGHRTMAEFTSPIGGTDPDSTLFQNQVRVQQIIADYKDSRFRFEKVLVEAHRYSATQRKLFLTGQEVAHIARVERTPPGQPVLYPPDDGMLVRNSVIEGISITGTGSGASGICNVEFTMSSQLPS